jgi:HemX protein
VFLLFLVATAFQTVGILGKPAGTEVNEILRQPWFGFHTLSAIFGYTSFAVSAVYSTLFLFLYFNLKRRRFGVVYDRVLSLEVVSRMAIRSATLGLAFLTASIVVGSFGWIRALDIPIHRDPKIVSTLIVWVVYGVGISLHYFTRWRGIRCIGITLAGFVLMVLSSWLVPAILQSRHNLKELL